MEHHPGSAKATGGGSGPGTAGALARRTGGKAHRRTAGVPPGKQRVPHLKSARSGGDAGAYFVVGKQRVQRQTLLCARAVADRLYVLQGAGLGRVLPESTVRDDYSRFIVPWELCTTMKADDVQRTIEQAMLKANPQPCQRPKLLSESGACYAASELKEYLKTGDVKQVHGKLLHPQTQGKAKTLSPFHEECRQAGSLLRP